MAGPWEGYQDAKPEQGPWVQYGGTQPTGLSARRGGYSGATLPKLKGSDISMGVPGAGEKEIGRKLGPMSALDIAKMDLQPIALGASVAAPIFSGGASLPVQMAIGGISGAAQSKLQGGGNKEAAISGGVGATLPAIGEAAPAVARGIGRAARIAGNSIDPDLAGLVSPRLAHALRMSAKIGKVATKLAPEVEAAPSTTLDIPLGPEKPAPEILQASPLGGAPASADVQPAPSSALGKIPTPKVAAAPESKPIIAPPKTKAALGRTLDENLGSALGAPRIKPGVPIREQFKPAGSLEPGHTPVESSAVKSFKYDAAKQELHVTTKNGTTYVSGEVTPEQAEAFKNAESKGKAWNEVRKSSPLVAKIVNGTRVAAKPTDFRSVGPNDDLTDALQESLARVKRRAGIGRE